MTSRVEDQAGAISRKRLWQDGLVRFARRYGLQIGIVCVLLVIWAFFIIGAPRTFLSREIYAAFMSTIPFFAIMALPLTMVVIAGEIDLSFRLYYVIKTNYPHILQAVHVCQVPSLPTSVEQVEAVSRCSLKKWGKATPTASKTAKVGRKFKNRP